MRKPLVVGNWKMNTSLDEARALGQAMVSGLSPVLDVEVVLCPPFPWLTEVGRLLHGSHIALGAQNMHTEAGGAYTGEVSARMLKGLCKYVLVGQYERRIYAAEKDAVVRRKLQVAQQHGLRPILCVGETADQLDEGVAAFVVAEQLEADLEGATLDARLVIAYDPVWTTMGLVAPPPLTYVGEIVGHIRETLESLYSRTVAEQTRLIYGGSVNPRTIGEIVADQRIDGVLTGSASLNAENFANIVRAFSGARAESRPASE
ncbi:MAG: triose-phosphate isomerase [Chloroflexi bacterium]|nr:triose-phosphate isomerase [Chloroflexota bacterium]